MEEGAHEGKIPSHRRVLPILALHLSLSSLFFFIVISLVWSLITLLLNIPAECSWCSRITYMNGSDREEVLHTRKR